MAANRPRYSDKVAAKRGEAIFEKKTKPHTNGEDENDFISIDIETGEYEIDEDELTACDRLNARVPNAQIWLRMVGFPYAYRFGGREIRGKS
jgi:hypothetical protein